MGFRFSLASVLKVRKNIEAREEAALQKAQYEVARIRQRIDEATAELARANLRRDEVLQAPVGAFQLQSLQAEIESIKSVRAALFSALDSAIAQRDAQMKLYQVAHANREMLTDLLRQKKILWERDQARAEQKRLDDIYSSRFARN